MPLAISTSWNAYRYNNARDLLFEIKELGLNDIELSFNLTEPMVSEVRGIAHEFGLNIVSLHNYCPIPDGFGRKEALPDCYSLSSLNSEERNAAVKYTKRTIDKALDLGAKAVVLHCGRVEIDDRTRKLISFFDEGRVNSKEFKELKRDFLMERSERAEDFLVKVLDSLEELEVYARGKGIGLGIENRFYYREIPSFEEVGIILGKFKGSKIFYWHDTGHAKVMQNLGFIKEDDYLEAYSKDLLGVHLHNIVGCDDHQAPIRGDLDFSKLKPYIKRDTIKVIEAHHPATAAEIKDSVELLKGVFDGVL
jgi:sugar phosphate isomerase/epimerase